MIVLAGAKSIIIGSVTPSAYSRRSSHSFGISGEVLLTVVLTRVKVRFVFIGTTRLLLCQMPLIAVLPGNDFRQCFARRSQRNFQYVKVLFFGGGSGGCDTSTVVSTGVGRPCHFALCLSAAFPDCLAPNIRVSLDPRHLPSLGRRVGLTFGGVSPLWGRTN